MRTMRAIVLILMLALVAAACGDGDADTTTTAGGDEAPTTEAEEAPATTAADEGDTTTTAAEMETEEVSLAIANLRAIQYFPIYVADAGGYFADEGIDVGEIEIISGSTAMVQQVIAGNIDFGVGSPTASISAVAGEQGDLVAYCTTHFQNIFTLAANAETGITDVAGLEGETVGITEASGGEVPLVRGSLATAGLVDGEDYQLLPIGEGGPLTFEALDNGDVAAYSSSVFDVAAVEAQGLELTHILPEEFLYAPSIGITVTRDTFENRSDVVTRFTRAIARAAEWGSQPENREAANAMIESYDPELFEDPEFADAVWEATLTLMTPPEEMSDAEYCAHYIPGWETYVEAALDTPVEEGGLPGDIDIPSVADDSLHGDINDYSEEDVAPPSG